MQQLTSGTPVRYTGPARRVDGVDLRPGRCGEVLASGGSGGSSGVLLSRPLGRREVLVVFDDVAVVVRRAHLEPLPREHPLRGEPDATLAAPLLANLRPWGVQNTVGTKVPALPGHDTVVAQVLHPWSEDREAGAAITWSQVAAAAGTTRDGLLDRDGPGAPTVDVPGYSVPEDGGLTADLAAALVDVLGGTTGTPDDVCFAVWEGWGSIDPGWWPDAAHVPLENRGSFLLRGPLAGLAASLDPMFGQRGAQLWWPTDLAWVAASEIDLPWTVIAGRPEVIAALRSDPRLEVVPTTHDTPAFAIPDPSTS
ncbi:hypothetical protein [Nitriliruptor alkaliphilus]|uniref:hypothetical protein n=1 Tax=Nitriliruptor alkaliphilus TaxID=427918 RepID=UPI00069630FF|nr:hypothetical protein [Nitriliruptor alkaliphilus]